MLDQALVECQHQWPDKDIEIGAQHYLENFYQSYGFQPTSAVYLEDGIPHIDMKLVK
ncbi:ElaA protein [Vibrio metschnikovii CIP 69.14]|nr:ElaA protein [Vibrio metschnikovii CIP 69.14]